MGFLYLMISVVLAAGGAAATVVLRGKKGAQPPCPNVPSDPYVIAYLNGDVATTIHVAIFHLCTTGLLTAVAGRLKVAKPGTEQFCENDLERAIVTLVGDGMAVDAVVNDTTIARATGSFRSGLIGSQLLADDLLVAANRNLALIIGGITAGISLLFIILQITVHKADSINDLGIVLLAILGIFGFLAFKTPRLTPRGNQTLVNMRNRYTATAKSKSSKGGPESLVITALFGFNALPATEQPLARVIFYKGKR